MAGLPNMMPGSRPGEIVLYTETTTACTHACDYCPIDSLERRGMISENVKDCVVRLLSSFPDRRFVVYPHLVGEPLLYPGLEDYIRTLAILPNVELWLCTNGVLLTEERLAGLHRAGLRNIWYSLFFTDSSEYRIRTRSDRFPEALANLFHLLDQNRLFDRIHIIAFSRDGKALGERIRGKTNVTLETGRKVHPWKSQGKWYDRRFFRTFFSQTGRFRTLYVTVSVDGQVGRDWRDYNFKNSLGNIQSLDRRTILAKTEIRWIDRARWSLQRTLAQRKAR